VRLNLNLQVCTEMEYSKIGDGVIPGCSALVLIPLILPT
jgi:hypothetical protein